MRIIDFRCRPNTPEYLRVIDAPTSRPVMRRLGTTMPAPGTLEQWVEKFGEIGIETAVFTGRQSRSTSGADIGNDYVADAATRFPGKIVGIAGIDPMRGMQSVRDVVHAIETLGLKGITVDPFGGQIAANDRRLYPVYAKCVELDVPVIITCGPLPFPGPRLAHGDVRAIDDVACDFPELTIVIDHSGWPWVQETIAIAFRHDNVFIDTSLYSHLPGGELFAEAANTIIPEKLLFASCYPVIPLEVAIERVRSLPFTPEALERVLYSNAAALLERFRAR